VVTAPDVSLAEALQGRYVLQRELGRGGMGIVWLAHDVKHDRQVAIKVLRQELGAGLGAERFLREVRISAHLQHPHVLTLIDSGEVVSSDPRSPGALYYVMPYVEGETLRRRLQREGRLPVAETVRYLQHILDALAHAHRYGIVHRDIKPENVMLAGRHALVMDFGIAKAAAAAGTVADTGGTLTTLGLAIGTPAYMAPEQAAGEVDIGPAADLYAVGVMGYEMLTGDAPFSGSTPQAVLAAKLTQTPEPLGRVRPDVPIELAAVIERCMERDPARRWGGAEEVLAALEQLAVTPTPSETVATRRPVSPRRKLARVAVVAGLAVLAGGAIWAGPGRRWQRERWAHDRAIPQLVALADRGEWDSAYTLARIVEAVNPEDSLFRVLRPKFARRGNLRTNPPGAEVWYQPYQAPDSSWTRVGTTPLDSMLLPLGATRLRLELPGRRVIYRVTGGFAGLQMFGDTTPIDPDTALPRDMIRITGGDLGVFFPGFEHVKPVKLGDYLLGRFEVTNAEFKRFVDSGGYRRRELWRHPFLRQGHELTWAQAMELMRDQTGRPGPSAWEGGDFPSGQADYPVGGLSWYEAAAYAEFSGASVPTVAHWNHAASVYHSAAIVPLSNFSGQGPSRVGASRAISAWGNVDMGGNVREWCFNAEGTSRFILGGGWNDLPYQFTDAYTQDPLDRSPTNGLRLARYLTADSSLAVAGAPLQRSRRDFLRERPAPDPVFAAYRQMYEYDRTPLDAAVVERVDEGDWVRELIRMRAAYADDSLLVYLYVPKRGARPYPAVVYFPGSNAIRDKAPQNLQWRAIDFIVKSGRAVLYPVYKGTYQRSDSLNTDVQDSTNFYRDHVLMWVKDLRRGVDYIATRSEITTDQLAYYGVSWGGAMGGLVAAVEPRIRVNLLYVAGLAFDATRPEVDPVNFLPRITVPTLMLNGKYDFFFPIESSQVPMFRLLGTPGADKRHVVDEGSHFVARPRLIQEILTWLDRYQPLPSGGTAADTGRRTTASSNR
jgi:tRNA A-37 threonylcarbamoyl transferase component Bud32/dienelactone hydrolase